MRQYKATESEESERKDCVVFAAGLFASQGPSYGKQWSKDIDDGLKLLSDLVKKQVK